MRLTGKRPSKTPRSHSADRAGADREVGSVLVVGRPYFFPPSPRQDSSIARPAPPWYPLPTKLGPSQGGDSCSDVGCQSCRLSASNEAAPDRPPPPDRASARLGTVRFPHEILHAGSP